MIINLLSDVKFVVWFNEKRVVSVYFDYLNLIVFIFDLFYWKILVNNFFFIKILNIE